MRYTFEEAKNVLLHTAEFADMDPLCGVSESLILGHLPRSGTGSCDVMQDIEKQHLLVCFQHLKTLYYIHLHSQVCTLQTNKRKLGLCFLLLSFLSLRQDFKFRAGSPAFFKFSHQENAS